nr:ankyrin repeat protein [Megavirus caiporensis]
MYILMTETKIKLPNKWMTCAKKHECLIIIPSGTYIYRGTTSKINSNYQFDYLFFSDFNTACWYAFASDFQKGEMGKVVCMRLKKDIILLDMDNSKTFELLYQFDNVPKYLDNEDVIKYAFGYDKNKSINNQILKRYSNNMIDQKFCKWFTNSITNINIDGYGFFGNKDFHNEIMITSDSIQNKLELVPIEYRFVINQMNRSESKHLLEIYKGKIMRLIPESAIDLFNGSKLNICWSYNMTYKPDPQRLMDKFYFRDN